jgi:hypothetical protein
METVTVTVTTDNPHAYARLVDLLEANPPDLDRHGVAYDTFVIVKRHGQSGGVLAEWASVYDGTENNDQP